MITDEKEELINFTRQLTFEIYDTYNTLKLHMHLHNSLVDNPEIGQLAQSYFVLTQHSLANDYIIRIARMFDKKPKGTQFGTLFKLLNLIEQNANLFTNKKSILKEVSRHRNIFDEDNAALLNNIKTWRDKSYAHWDKKYFYDEDRLKLEVDAPIKYNQLYNLLRTSGQIANFYLKELGESPVPLEIAQIKDDINELFKAIKTGMTLDTDLVKV
ncbi:AbiU2 domain-containing protein [Priestia aryabhattai]